MTQMRKDVQYEGERRGPSTGQAHHDVDTPRRGRALRVLSRRTRAEAIVAARYSRHTRGVVRQRGTRGQTGETRTKSARAPQKQRDIWVVPSLTATSTCNLHNASHEP